MVALHTVVVGGASGIGRATAQVLAARGHRVVVADLDGAGAAAVAAGLGEGHRSAAVDVTDEESVARLFSEAAAESDLTGAVNCAGVGTFGRVVEHDTAEFKRIVDVCLGGAFLVLKHAGQHVVDGGSLVTLASLNARQPGTALAAYCSAKAGVVMLSQVAALELAERRVRVNTVSPGLVLTPLTEASMQIPGVREDYLDNTPLGRTGEPEEVAAAVAFLLSDDSAWMTGENLDLNGGAHLQRYPDMYRRVMAAFG